MYFLYLGSYFVSILALKHSHASNDCAVYFIAIPGISLAIQSLNSFCAGSLDLFLSKSNEINRII